MIDAVRGGADARGAGVPVADTLKRVEGMRIVETVDRDGLVAVQTPQAFRADCLRAAHAVDADATDDAALVEAAGGTVVVVAGDPRNVKVTTVADLAVVEALLVRHARRSRLRCPRVREETAAARARWRHRAGRTWSRRPLRCRRGRARGRGRAARRRVDARSRNALPGQRPALRGVSSMALLDDVHTEVLGAGWTVAQRRRRHRSRISAARAHVAAMSARLGEAVGAPVSVKPKRAEGVGAIGRGEGIAAWAVALLESSG